MSFKINCDIPKEDGKKCNKEISPKIKKDTGELYCECGKKLINQDCITQFAKNNLISLGQIHNGNNIDKKPFAVKCDKCEYTDTPVLDRKNKKLTCSACKKELNVNEFFKKTIFEKLK